jgi:anti-sigma factor RsiW
MKEMDTSSTCERAGDLVAVLYGEATEREQREFELHVKQCGECRAEFAAFAQVREAIGEWRDEALNGFVSSPMVAAPSRKSALAALRQFFALSPMWMKGAVGFAAVAFCVLVVLALSRTSSPTSETPVVGGNRAAVYTKEDLDRAVADALAKQEATFPKDRERNVVEQSASTVTVSTSGSKSSSGAKSSGSTVSTRAPHERRPFSRAEREQLAADLRLLTGSDESDLDLDR